MDEAARHGVFAYLVDGDAEQFRGALEVMLQRFREYHHLQGAFGRNSRTERAKGILMERHQIEEDAAFQLLRELARAHNRKIVEVADAILGAHQLLPPFRRRVGDGDSAAPDGIGDAVHST